MSWSCRPVPASLTALTSWNSSLPRWPGSRPDAGPAMGLGAGQLGIVKRSAHSPGRSAELADSSDGLIDGMAVGDLDVVDDGAIPEHDQPVAAGGDLRVMGSDDDRH